MDVDISTLVKNHDENKTFILVKLSESFSNAIQEYSAAQQQQHQQQHQQQYQQHHQKQQHQQQHLSHHQQHQQHKHQHQHNNSSFKSSSSSSLTSYPPPKHTLSSSKTLNNKRPKLQHSVNDSTSTLSNYSNISNQNNSHNNNVAPTIKFRQDGARGTIKFPNGKCYDFSLEQSDNSVECIKQTKKKWESVGKMACCLHVKGKDDVYQRTRTKMEAAEQEKRKYCTKLLDNNSKSNNSSSINMNNNSSSNNNNTNTNNNNNIINNISSNNINNNISTNNNSNNNNNHVNLSKYPDITDVKQLKKYKADFDKDYEEYQNLHGYLHRIEERFKKLRESLEQSVVGSPEWESAKEHIFDEYERVKSDSNFHRARSKYKQLYNKLAHIKKKIFQFKRQQKDKFNTNHTSSRPRQYFNNKNSKKKP